MNFFYGTTQVFLVCSVRHRQLTLSPLFDTIKVLNLLSERIKDATAYNLDTPPRTKAIETGMILSIMDMKKTLMYIFHRSIFTEIREFATIVLWKLVINFGV